MIPPIDEHLIANGTPAADGHEVPVSWPLPQIVGLVDRATVRERRVEFARTRGREHEAAFEEALPDEPLVRSTFDAYGVGLEPDPVLARRHRRQVLAPSQWEGLGLWWDCPTEGALLRFARLARAKEDAVVRFVQRHGPLGIDDLRGLPQQTVSSLPLQLTESIRWYRLYAALVDTALRVAIQAHRGRGPAPEHVAFFRQFDSMRSLRRTPDAALLRSAMETLDLAGSASAPDEGTGPARAAGSRAIVTAIVSWWLYVGGVRPTLVWRGESTTPVTEWSGGVWGAIGLQLLHTVQHEANIAVCDGCGHEVRLQRKPKKGQAHWCHRDECQKRRQRRYDAKRIRRSAASDRGSRRPS